MKKHLFLYGPPGSGKSALLLQALGPSVAGAGGYLTLPGKPKVWHLLPSAAAAGVEGFTALPYLDLSGPAPVKDNEVFRGEAARLLREAAWYPFSVLDAFGGFELVIPQYREALADFLNLDNPCLGVLLRPREVEELRRLLGLGDKLTAYVRRLWESLEADPDTLLLQTTGAADPVARRILDQWVREYV